MKKKTRTPTESKKKSKGSLPSIVIDGEDVDNDDNSSGAYLPQSRKMPLTKHCHGASVASTSASNKKSRGRHDDSDNDSSAFSLPQSKKTSSRKRRGDQLVASPFASKTKWRGRHDDSDDDSSALSLPLPRKKSSTNCYDYAPVSSTSVS